MKPRSPFCFWFRCLAGCLSLVPLVARAEDQPPTDDAILQVLRRRVDDKKKGVGVVVGWVDEHGSRVVSYGKTRLDGGVPVDGKTMFEIGSITKVFTSLLLAEAVEKGEVKLDDPVSKYLPAGVKVPFKGRQITLIDLATHRSGLPMMPDNIHPQDEENPYADYQPNQLFAFLSGCQLTRNVGEGYEYSNLGVSLLGQVLARRAGKNYGQLVEERICRPLGMASTSVVLSDEQRQRLAAPYKENLASAKNWDLDALVGAGGLRSDVEDMLKFLAAEMGLADSPLRPAMRETQRVRATTDGEGHDIGLNWMVDHPDGSTFIWHNGGTGGYRSFVGFVPEKRWGVVMLSNTANEVDSIGYQLTHPAKEHKAVTIKPESVDRYVGRYQLAPHFVLTFSREGGRYFLQATGQGKNEVFPESEKDFFLKAVDAQISFVVHDEGKVTALVLHQSGDQTAKRLP